MELMPTQEEVLSLLRDTGALRKGHFEYPSGLHSEEYLNVALAMRYYQHARTLGVALSRKVRWNTELRAMIGELSIVAAGPTGIPVAYAVCEALRASQVYWSERDSAEQPLHFRQGVGEKVGEKVLMVDDILRSGRRLTELRKLVESSGDEVVGLAVMIYQPNPESPSFDPLPFFYLAKLEGMYYRDAHSCELCKAGVPLEKVQV
ncbi:MAG: phosphoribosyltransferase [Bryobacteraceae bacterium]|nr:phosphoribosyltransferase [Bryobacteraceae bacterium]